MPIGQKLMTFRIKTGLEMNTTEDFERSHTGAGERCSSTSDLFLFIEAAVMGVKRTSFGTIDRSSSTWSK